MKREKGTASPLPSKDLNAYCMMSFGGGQPSGKLRPSWNGGGLALLSGCEPELPLLSFVFPQYFIHQLADQLGHSSYLELGQVGRGKSKPVTKLSISLQAPLFLQGINSTHCIWVVISSRSSPH
jgi:hypothetical protein